jgi:hypothetical protein
VAVTGGRISAIGPGLQGRRVLDASGQVVSARVHRHPHPLRRPGVLGPVADPVLLPRGDVGHRRQLRLLHRAHPRRRRAAAGPHPPARGGHELRHAGRRRALGRVRDLPPVPRRRRARGARRSTTAATSATPRSGSTSWARTPTSGPPPPTRSRACRRWWPRPWPGRRRRLRLQRLAHPQRRRRPPVPSRVADLDELRALLEPLRDAGAAWWPCCRAASSPNEEVFALQREWGAPSPGRRCSR